MLTNCPTHAVCPHCREGWGHLTDGGYVPTIESEAVPLRRTAFAPVGGVDPFYEIPPDEPLGFCAGCGHHPTVCTCRGACPDCCAEDHCQICDCCCEPETP